MATESKGNDNKKPEKEIQVLMPQNGTAKVRQNRKSKETVEKQSQKSQQKESDREYQSQRKNSNSKARKRKKRKKELTKEQIQVRKKRRKKSVKKYRAKYWTTGKKVLLGICIFLLLLVGAAIAFVMSKMSLIQTSKLDPDKLSIYDDLQYEESGYLNVALFGLDTRATDETMGSRSDTIMIASLNRETKEVKIVSVYRDTLLQQDDGTYNKANAAYSFGGAESAIAMLNKNLDMDIQHFVTVDFSALVDVIDAVGGIEIEVTEEEIPYLNNYAVEIIENTGVDSLGVTEPGLQLLNGVQATAYARIRYTEGDDYKRTERQREVLTKTAEKLQQADLGKLNKIIDKVFPMVETNFTLPEILAYAKDVAKYWFGETEGFPFEKDTAVYEDAGDSVIPWTLASNVKELHQLLFPELSYTPSYQVQDISRGIVYATGVGDYGESSYSENTYNEYGGYSGFDYENNYSDENYYNNEVTETEEYYDPYNTEDEYNEDIY